MDESKRKQKKALPQAGGRKKLPIFLIFGLILFFAFASFFSKKVFAANSPAIITYQGKLLTNNSLATTTQSMYFVLYDAASAGSVLYTASGTTGVPLSISVTPSQGLFSVNLGDTGTNSLDQSIFQNNSSVYLEVRIGSDTLSPRKRITSVPYAFNARYLDGVAVSAVSSSTYIPRSDSNGNFTFNSTTISTSTITALSVLGTTSLSVISSGTWNGSVISPIYGGIGQNSSGWSGLIRVTAGVWATSSVSLATDVSGILSIARGGTNSSTLAANGSVIYSDGAGYNATAVGVSGQVLQSTGSGAPVWVATSSLGISGNSYSSWTLATSTDDIGYSVTSGVKVVFSGIDGITTTRSGATLSVGLTSSGVNAGTYGSASTIPVLTIDAFGRVIGNASTTIAIAGSQITSGTVSSTFGGTGQDSSAWTGLIRVTSGIWSTSTVLLASDVTGVLSIANGGTNSSTLAANGSLIYSDGTRYNAVAVGNSGYVLQSTGSGAPVWVATSSLGIGGNSYASWTLATSTDDIGYSVTSGVKVVFSGINGVTTTRSGATLSVGLTNSGVNAGTYGSSSAVAILTIDSFGRIISNATSSIAIAGNQITSGVVSPTFGGIGQDSSAWTGLIRVTAGTWSTTTVSLTTDVNGVLSIANGGTNSSTLAANGSLIYSDGTRYNAVAVGNSGYVLQSTGSGAPVWVATSSLGFVNLQGSSPGTQQIGSFNLSGTGIIGTSFGVGTSTVSSTLVVQALTGVNPLRVVSSSGSNLFVIRANGTAGINVDSPQAKFDVRDLTPTSTGAIFQIANAPGTIPYMLVSSTATSIRGASGTVNFELGVTTDNLNQVLIHGDNASLSSDATKALVVNGRGNLYFQSGNANRMLIKSSGLIGINTTTQQALLTVQGRINEDPFVIASSSGPNLFRVRSNGNVGIGTSSPTQKLSVVGNISNITEQNTSISEIVTTSVGSVPQDIFVSGKYAYVANYADDTLSVVDVSNPLNPQLISNATLNSGANPHSVFVSGRYAYTANQSQDTLSIIDISNPAAPVQVSTVVAGSGPISAVVSGKYAYIGSLGNAIYVIDISDPLSATRVATSSVETGAGPRSLYVSGRYLYAGNYLNSTIGITDISNPLNPVLVGTTTVGSNPSSIYVSGRYAYLANSGSGSVSVVDVSNAAAPNTVATISVTGAYALHGSGRYLYVTNYSDSQVVVVDIINPLSPVIVNTVSLSGVNPASIFVSGRYAYTVNESSANISIIDISGTEVTSLIAHSAEVGNIQSRNDIFAQGNIMAGTSLSVGAGGIMSQGALSVFASSTGSTSTIFNISSAQVKDIFRVFANGTVLFAGSASSSIFNVDGRLGINSTSPVATLGIKGAAGVNLLEITSSTGASLVSILTNGNVGIGTSSPSQKLSVEGNIANLIGSNTALSMVSSSIVGTNPVSVFVSGRYAYTANSGSDNISIIDVSNPSAPVQISTTSVGGAFSYPISISVSGQYAYTANYSLNTISVVDISNPFRPVQVATASVGGNPSSIYISGRYAYVSNYASNTVSIVDISNPRSPTQISTVTVGTNPYSVFVSGRYAYAANFTSNNISVVDISNPSAPVQVGTTVVGGGPYSVYVSGRYAYTANTNSNTISVVDISNPSAPVQVATTSVGVQPYSVFVSGRYLYAANRISETISVVDISNPSAPVQVATTSVGVSSAPNALYISGRYAYTANYGTDRIAIFDISGTEVSSLMAHSAEVGNIQSRNDIFAQGNIMAGTSLLVGSGGIMSQGALSIFASSTGATSSIFNIASSASSSILKVFANGRIGINSSSPYANLSVNGDLAVTGGIYDSAGSRGINGQVLQTNGTVITWVSTSSLGLGGNSVGSGTTGQFGYYSATGTTLTATSSLFLAESGNIGINTTTPLARLSVVGFGAGSVFDVASSTGASFFRILANGNIGINSSSPVASLGIRTATGTNPFLITSSTTGATLVSVLTNGNVGIGTSTPAQKLSVVGNISNVIDTDSPISVVSTTGVFGTSPYDIAVSGRFAYVAYSGGSMVILDIINPSAPVSLSTSTFTGSARGIYVAGQYAYVSNASSNTLHIYNVANPSAPVFIATTSVGTGPEAVYVSGRYAYVANLSAGSMSIVDVANPYSPRQISSVSSAGGRGVVVNGKYAYSGSLGSQTVNVIDVSNPSSPVVVGTVNIGVSPYDIAFSDGYIYTTNYVSASMSVVNVKNPTSPTLVTSTPISNNSQSIAVSGRYAYFAGAGKFTAVDISDPSRPLVIKGIVTAGNPVSVAVSGRYAYVANYSNNTVSIVDISGTEVSSLIAHSAEVGNLQSRNDIFAQGNIIAGTGLMVGAGGIMSQGTLSVFASSTGVTSSIFNISSVQNTNIFKAFANGTISIGTSTASSTLTIQGVAGSNPIFTVASSTGESLLKILANGNVGIGTSTPAQKLSVVGGVQNILDPSTTISEIATTSVGRTPRSVYVLGRYAYVTNETSSTISVVDISNPSVPVQISTTSVDAGPHGIYVSGRYAYVAGASNNSVAIVDISNSKSPIQVGSVSVPSVIRDIQVVGKYAYLNYDSGGIIVLDVSNPRAPALVVSTSFSGTNPNAIAVSGRYAYLAEDAARILVVDISNPAAPILVGSTTVGLSPQAIAVSGRYAYIANAGENTMSVVDISNPLAPVQVATTTVGSTPLSIAVSGRYAYVANALSSTISVIDIINPLAPRQLALVSVGTNILPADIFISGRYAYTANIASGTLSGTMSVIDLSGTEVSSLIAHSAEVGSIQSRNDIFAQGNIMAGTSLIVGSGGLMSQGALSIFASSTGATSSIFNIASAASSSIFRVLADGRIGINSSTPNYGLVVNNTVALPGIGAPAATGDIVCYATGDGKITHQATNCTVSSARFKENIQSLSPEDLLDKVNRLRAVSFDFKPGQIPDHGLNGGGKESSGFIAEEVAQIDPMLVIYTDTYSSEDLLFDQINYPGAILYKDGKTLIPQTVDYARISVLLTGAIQDIDSRLTTYASSTALIVSALSISSDNNTITFGSSSNPYNLIVTGNISLNNSNVINTLSFATTTLFESSVGSFAGARAFTFNAINFNGPLADNYIISLRANNNSVFSVAANGDVHASGNYYGASAVLGTSTNPGDLAERVDIAIDDVVEAGDVVVVDQNSPDTYRRSTVAYEQSVAGVISTNPTIVVGNGRTDYTAVMAMVGRVPVKVSAENGSIARGDLLVAGSQPGYAMKYDATRDDNNKMVGVIGIALESLPTSSGKILALIRTGWVYNRDKDISSLQNNIEQLAVAQGINLDPSEEPGNLSIQNNNNQLVYAGGNLDLQNNSIINIAGIFGKNNKWKIDEFGNLIQKITTVAGDKEIYGLQSSGKQELVISGTSTLENGSRRVVLTDLDQAIIDKTVPLKISITMSGETKGFYVSERSYDSFVVKENENGQSNAPFDWIVIAKVLDPENIGQSSPVVEGEQPPEINSSTPESSPQGEEPTIIIPAEEVSSSTENVSSSVDVSSSTP
ncbi:MAG: beta-propeller fold lactonase family protein [Candidatus Magasanikbacteria bacterium]|nr:beta-propeller fold lactonase family protein [Candidatus Magasanikbacteria bacterium]